MPALLVSASRAPPLAATRAAVTLQVVTIAQASPETSTPARRADDPNGWGAMMIAAQAGDAAPYRRLLGELRPWLLRYFARRLPPASVDDAVQDTLVAIHAKRHTFDPDRPFGPWLSGIARYKWIDRLRSAARHAATELPETLSTPDHESAVTSALALRGLLATLKPAQAEVIRLVKLDGFSIEDAAARTGQSPALVKVNIHRGLGRLARLVETRAESPDDAD